jgi:hypothetical protein
MKYSFIFHKISLFCALTAFVVSSVNAQTSSYTVKCFDAKLNLLTAKTVLAGNIVPSSSAICGAGTWYLAKGKGVGRAITKYTLGSDVNFYASPNAIEIADQYDLEKVAQNLNGDYILVDNIPLSLSGTGWTPLGSSLGNSFNGTFEGDGFTISGLWTNITGSYVGLFGYVTGEVKNFVVEIDNANNGVIGSQRVGTVAGQISHGASIINVNSTGNVYASTDTAGGIAGQVGDISGNPGFIAFSHSEGDITAARGITGGIVGNIQAGNVTDSFSTGTIGLISVNSAGGIAGNILSGNITNSYSTGDIRGYNYVGGIVGEVGNSGNVNITNVYSTGDISGNRYYVGGIAGGSATGTAWSVKNSYASGNIAGSISNDTAGGVYVGGIVGMYGTVTNSAAINPSVIVPRGTYVNRIAGYAYSASSNNYALDTMNIPVQNNGIAGTNSTIGDLQNQTFYTGTLQWSFGNSSAAPWTMDKTISPYPIFYWQ